MSRAVTLDLPGGFSERDLKVEQVRLVYGRIRATQWPMVVLTLAVAWVFRSAGWSMMVWLTAQVALKVMELIELRWFASDTGIVARPQAFQHRLMVTQGLHAAAWAALACVVLPHAHPPDFVLVFLILAGIASGSVTAYAPLLAVFTLYIGIEVGLLVITLMVGHSAVPIGFSPLFISLYGLAMWAKARDEAKESRRTILLGFANLSANRNLEREADLARQAQAEAVEANLAKSRFLAAASHDLRQPLHALGLFLGILDRSARGALQKEAAANARAAADASSNMLDALLDFSRADAGVIIPRPRMFALFDVLEELTRELLPQAQAKGLTLQVRPTALKVRSDPALVQMVLSNLVSNAIRYTRRGGVLVGCRLRGGQVVLEVWDTGEGIPADQIDAVFQEFVQLGNPERDRRKGLGLGLAIARRLSGLLDGELSVQSNPGRGSVFKLSFPLTNEVVGDDFPASSPVAAQTVLPLRILVIEDDEAIRLGMLEGLKSAGHLCEAVETLDQALACIKSGSPNLVICDYRLRRGLNGVDAVNALRNAVGARIPALIITGDTHPGRLDEAADAGVSVLHKPVSLENLEAAVQRLFQKGDIAPA